MRASEQRTPPPWEEPRRLSSGRERYRDPPRNPQYRERQVSIGFAWPAALALLVSFTLGSGRGAWLLLDGEKVGRAFTAGTRWFVILICAQMFLYPVSTWAVRLLERLLVEGMRRPRQRQKARRRRTPPIINTRSSRRKKPKTKQERREGLLSGLSNGLNAVGEVLVKKRQPFEGGHFASTAPSVSLLPKGELSDSEQDLVDLYVMTHHMYSRKLTRDSFEDEWPGENGQHLYAMWKRHWVRRGWVGLKGNGSMFWRYEEHELYQSDPAVRAMAERMGFQFPGGEG